MCILENRIYITDVEEAKLECRKARQDIQLYIDNTKPIEDREVFLKHVCSCSDCYEELEISYIFLEGMRRLDGGEDIAVDFQKELDYKIHKELYQIHKEKRKRLYFIIAGIVLSIFGIFMGYFERECHDQTVMSEMKLARGQYYFYENSKSYIFQDGMYVPPSLREIIYYGK